jgi:hypothetical protein
MTAFRLFDPFQTFTDLHGNLAVGGNLTFYAAGTTAPQSVYADPALSADNGNTVAIGVDGRPVNDIWGSGAYRARLYAADGTLISDVDNIQIPGGTGTTIPALVSGQFLTNDGAILSWEQIKQLPDPTGSANKILSNDGSNFIWVAKPADGKSAAVTVTPTKATIGDGSSTQDVFVVQSGTDTAAASSTHTTTKAVTFATPFKALMGVMVTPTSTNITSSGFNPIGALAGSSTSGFTAQFDINEASGSFSIVNPIGFQWVAFGTIAA